MIIKAGKHLLSGFCCMYLQREILFVVFLKVHGLGFGRDPLGRIVAELAAGIKKGREPLFTA